MRRRREHGSHNNDPPRLEGRRRMIKRRNGPTPRLTRDMARELGQAIIVLALTGSSVGGFLGMIAIATRALGR
jgi:hypothetical protein